MNNDPFFDWHTIEHARVPNRKCLLCNAETRIHYIELPVWMLNPIPRQMENGVRIYRWQCMRFPEHNGEFRVPKEINNG